MSVAAVEVRPPAVVVSPSAVGTAPGTAQRRPWGWIVAAGLALLTAALLVTAATVDGDGGQDVFGLLGSVGRDLVRLRWQFAVIVVGLGAMHYVASTAAARAASGLRLPFAETFLVQLAAAAANRLTPAGLGGSALNVRYFTRRGLPVAAAVGAVSALAVLGAVADLLALVLLVSGASALGFGNGASQFGALLAHVRHLLGPARSPWLWLAVAVVVGALGARWLLRGRSRGAVRGGFLVPARRLLTRPRALATVLAASASTTLVLGLAFVACIAMVPGPRPAVSMAVVLIAYMLGSAAGSTVPVPAGLGSTEGALVAALMSVGEPAAHAVQVVMIFRLITFWSPAAVGVLATRALHRRSAF